MLITERKAAELRSAWSQWIGYDKGGFKDVLDTIDVLWAVARAGASIEDVLEVPPLLGDSGRQVVADSIERFRAALAKTKVIVPQ